MSILKFIYRSVLKINYLFKMIFFNNEKKFNYIYKKNIWGSNESISGPGSEIRNTIAIRRQIPKILYKYKIKKILDLPCGDFHWFKEIDLKINYLGADIVDSIINENNLKYSNDFISFKKLDITSDPINDKFDLILIRDLFIHFSNNDIFRSLNNIKESRSKYILTTNYNDPETNKNIVSGSFREINLMLEPFNFPPPILEIEDSGHIIRPNSNIPYQNKFLSLWSIEDLKI